LGGDIPSFLSGFSAGTVLQYHAVANVAVLDYLQLPREDVCKQKHKEDDDARSLANEQISKEICNEAAYN
jgi:hypothetical protein